MEHVENAAKEETERIKRERYKERFNGENGIIFLTNHTKTALLESDERCPRRLRTLLSRRKEIQTWK